MRKNGAGSAPGRRHARTTRSHGTRNDGRTQAIRPTHPQMVLRRSSACARGCAWCSRAPRSAIIAICAARKGVSDNRAHGERRDEGELGGLEGAGLGRHTCLKSPSLLQHLGLVGAAGPRPGSREEHRSPLVHAGLQARRQAHIVQVVRSRCGRARAPKLPQTPRDP